MANERQPGYQEPGQVGQSSWDQDEREADGWGGTAPFKPLTREEATALRARQVALSPWWIVGTQVVVGALAALVALWITGRAEAAWSAAYGCAVTVVPGALMARGMTSRLSSVSPGVSAVSVLLWASVKIAASIAMLLLAHRVVPGLVWPALLVSLVLCMNVYVVALLWRGRRQG